MELKNTKRSGSKALKADPIINAIFGSKKIAILSFDSKGYITNYSTAFAKIIDTEENYSLGKHLRDLPFSKGAKRIGILNFDYGVKPSQSIFDVKIMSVNGSIQVVDLNIELAFNNEVFSGGILQFDVKNNKKPKGNYFNNLLSKSEFYLKEPLRISSRFSEQLNKLIPESAELQKEYINFVSSNLKSLTNLVNHLIILENLNIYHTDLKHINLDVLFLIEFQNKNSLKPKLSLGPLPDLLYCDKELIKLFLKTLIEFAFEYTSKKDKSLKINGFSSGKSTVLKIYSGVFPFLDNPNFSISAPLNKLVDLNHTSASGYELAIINQIIKLHNGTIEISNTSDSESQIVLTFPKK